MQQFTIPTCYFPSTTVFIDDSRDFLLNFVLHLDESLAYRVFDSPFDALACIQGKRCELELLSQRCLSEYTEAKNCPLTNHTINLDLATIHAEVYNPGRFSEISVIVVDYAMPGMDGLEFCKKLENANIKKILLTGQADEKLAIEAFNEGLIHRYIKKSDPDISDLIVKSIHDLQLKYFQSMSDMVVRMLSVTSPSCLHDKQFAELFWKICRKNKIVEFYLADNSGSFVMFDIDANISFLIVKNEADMRLHYDLALDNGASEEVLDQLYRREKIPCVWHSNTLNSHGNDWANCLVPAEKYVSSETYYYAYVKGAVLFNVRLDKVLPYHQFLEKMDAEELLLETQA